MPRSSSSSRSSSSRSSFSGSSGSSPSYSSSRSSALQSTATPTNTTSLQTYPQQEQKNGFLSSVKDGFAIGTGMSIARRVVDGFFPLKSSTLSSSSSVVGFTEKISVCKQFQEELTECIQTKQYEGSCERELSNLRTCLEATPSH